VSIFNNLSSIYDRGMLPLEWLVFRRLRRRTFPPLRGHVLELGTGTGVNLPLYGPEARVAACDASGEMLTWAARRHTQTPVLLAQADVQHLPFPDASFDVVAASLVFCSVADPAWGLAEARHPLWHTWSRECHLNRETVQTVAEAGFQVEQVKEYAMGIVRVIEATI